MSDNQEKIIPINIEDEMKTAYIDYSMSVIVSRALPDVRDGLKPVHRRVLYGMNELGVGHNKTYKKSARIVGEILGKYHPHGDTSVYDTMVRMAQEWSMRYPLVDGQGNFGSVDGDSPAAMRYTEARLTRIAGELLDDLDKETVDFRLNFDDTLEEPTVLPAKFPNLLVNGSSGIAVGMATNMAPHNLTEVIDGVLAYIDDNEIPIEDLLKYVKGPDFPTGAIIYGYEGVRNALLYGKGRIVLRARAEIEVMDNGRERIVVSEIPYLVNKADMLEKTGQLINDKKIEGISDVRDESDRDGMRVVYELKRDAVSSVVLNQLYSFTTLQNTFSVNNIALVNGRPVALNLKDMMVHFVNHRIEVIVRRTKFELRKAEERAHILKGLLIALDHLDEVIALIRASQTPDEAKDGLMSNFGLSEIQAKAILEMRLQRLTGLERDKIREEYEELMNTINRLKEILASEVLQMEIIKQELTEIREKYGDERRSEIVYAADDFRMEDLIPNDTVILTISHLGYVKRTLLSEYRTQRRGGKGVISGNTRETDFVEHIYSASNHDYLMLFTEQGKCYWMKVYEIPEGSKTQKGRAIQNLIAIPNDDKIKGYITVKDLKDADYINNKYLMFCTKKGIVKKTSLEAYSRPRSGGINAITINEGDQLLNVVLTSGSSEILLAIKSGRAIRFNESKVRSMGRNATGVRGIDLDNETDEVIGMVSVNLPEETILVLSEKGYGKRSALEDYRITNRGGKGVKTMNITPKTGSLVALQTVTDDYELMIIRKDGVSIRIGIEELRVMGRATQGVKLIRLNEGEEIASVARVNKEDEEPEIIINTEGEVITSSNEPSTPAIDKPTDADDDKNTEAPETDKT